MSSIKKPIRVALHGMDDRTYKSMVMYLQGPCKGIAIIVDEFEAEIDIIDADHVKIKDVLAERKSKAPDRPIILLSLETLSEEGTIHVKKPIKTADLVSALKKADLGIDQMQAASKEPKPEATPKQEPETEKKTASASKNEQTDKITKEPEYKKVVDREEAKKTSKHQTSTRLNEGSFSAYIGHVEGVDFSTMENAMKAVYDPKNYFLGYAQSAVKTAGTKSRILQLNSGWKPLLIFPQSHEVWLDADDKQLRAFSGISLKTDSQKKEMKLGLVNQKTSGLNQKMENFFDSNAFLWKLAIWTSKGRYPESIDINKPVFLKHWPNFTRLLITPHALRISAVMIEGPRTLINIAQSLNIKPQYVFIFVSAAATVGLVGQATRMSDEIISPPEIKKPKPKALLGRILGRLRGS